MSEIAEGGRTRHQTRDCKRVFQENLICPTCCSTKKRDRMQRGKDELQRNMGPSLFPLLVLGPEFIYTWQFTPLQFNLSTMVFPKHFLFHVLNPLFKERREHFAQLSKLVSKTVFPSCSLSKLKTCCILVFFFFLAFCKLFFISLFRVKKNFLSVAHLTSSLKTWQTALDK